MCVAPLMNYEELARSKVRCSLPCIDVIACVSRNERKDLRVNLASGKEDLICPREILSTDDEA